MVCLLLLLCHHLHIRGGTVEGGVWKAEGRGEMREGKMGKKRRRKGTGREEKREGKMGGKVRHKGTGKGRGGKKGEGKWQRKGKGSRTGSRVGSGKGSGIGGDNRRGEERAIGNNTVQKNTSLTDLQS